MSDLSDAHDRAIERGRNDAINLVPFTVHSYKKSDYGLGVVWETWMAHSSADRNYLRKRAGP